MLTHSTKGLRSLLPKKDQVRWFLAAMLPVQYSQLRLHLRGTSTEEGQEKGGGGGGGSSSSNSSTDRVTHIT